MLAGRTLSVTPAACQLLRGFSPLKTSRTLTPPRECFHRKPARQLPLSVMTPPVCRLVWDMNKVENDAYLEKALSGIPEHFSGKLLEVPVGTGILTIR